MAYLVHILLIFFIFQHPSNAMESEYSTLEQVNSKTTTIQPEDSIDSNSESEELEPPQFDNVCAHCLGQIVGSTQCFRMTLDEKVDTTPGRYGRGCAVTTSLCACGGGGMVYLDLICNPLCTTAFTPIGTIMLCPCYCMGISECIYHGADFLGKEQVVTHANFTRKCSPRDPCSIPSWSEYLSNTISTFGKGFKFCCAQVLTPCCGPGFHEEEKHEFSSDPEHIQ